MYSRVCALAASCVLSAGMLVSWCVLCLLNVCACVVVSVLVCVSLFVGLCVRACMRGCARACAGLVGASRPGSVWLGCVCGLGGVFCVCECVCIVCMRVCSCVVV